MANQGAWFHYGGELGPRFQPIDAGSHVPRDTSFGFCSRNIQGGPVGSAICSEVCGQHAACSCGRPANHPQIVESSGPRPAPTPEPAPVDFPTSRDLFAHILLQLGPDNHYGNIAGEGLRKFGLVPEKFGVQTGLSPQEVLLLGLLVGYLEKISRENTAATSAK